MTLSDSTPNSQMYADPAHLERRAGLRRAEIAAAHLLPHLTPGLRVLDVGSGSGSITLDLAAVVAPGEVVGVDVEPAAVEFARNLAAQRAVANVRFEVGSAYALPFPDACFDVVNAVTVLMHLGEPLRALQEFRRVVRPGGLVAVSDQDTAGMLLGGADTTVERAVDLIVRFWGLHGSPAVARNLPGLLHAAGLVQAEVTARALLFATTEQLTRWAEDMVMLQRTPAFRSAVLAQGWATEKELDAIADGLREWAQRPDALLMVPAFPVLGRVPQ